MMEQLGCLSVLLASCSVLSWMVPLEDSPPPPTLSLDPQYPVYIQGEQVTLICSAPEGREVAGYIFYKEQQGQTSKELPNKGMGRYEAFNVNTDTAGRYSCVYWILLPGQEIKSPKSNLISIPRTERPRRPRFSVSPKQDVYRSGESINLTCSAPDKRQMSKVLFSKDGVPLLPIHPPSISRSLQLLPQDGGRYACKYQVVESGREISSPESSSIHISVTADENVTPPPPSSLQSPALSAPTLSLNPQGPLYIQGDQVTLECSAPERLDVASYTFYKKRHKQTPKELPRKGRGPNEALTVDENTAGEYSCRYSKLQSRKESQSPRSNFVSVAMKVFSMTPKQDIYTRGESIDLTCSASDPLLLPLAVGCGGGGALVLLAALVCLYKRKQKASSRISSRTYWNSFKSQRSTKKRRCQDPIGIAITLQERDEPSESMGQDWGILPKSKIRAPKVGGPSKEKKREEDADSGAVFEFPEMDPNYTLLGFPCSTFYWDENEGSTVEAHLSQQDI